jgi:hypothetical protein
VFISHGQNGIGLVPGILGHFGGLALGWLLGSSGRFGGQISSFLFSFLFSIFDLISYLNLILFAEILSV